MNNAVFLDRDGVLNDNILNPLTGAWESPHRPEDLHLKPGVVNALRHLHASGFLLIVVSNQPSYAKGKTTLKNLHAVSDRLQYLLEQQSIYITRYAYCLHHPEGLVAGVSGRCECRKPSPFFLHEAARDYSLDLSGSWMVGDRDSDILCGKRAGTRTILVDPDHPTAQVTTSNPDFRVKALTQAADLILSFRQISGGPLALELS